MKLTIPEIEIMSPGHVACQGCGATLAFRYALKALGRGTIVIIPACCWSVIDGPFPYSSAGVPVFHTAFETAASTASGVRAALEIKGITDVSVLAWAGDGGTMDIGIQALSGAVERGEDIIYVCYDNEAYMNTGIQRSSSTPYGAWTTTTPVKKFKTGPKKNMVEIMAAHKIPYTATANIAFPEDFIAKLRKAKTIKGPKFIQIISPCPAGWKFPSQLTVKIAKLSFETCVFPLYEVEN
ncbi:MAG: thiamine pyrophosphate-dependent enzyme, partial [Candidatus Omnitrophota bacterium]|nr:thiamine pyrophosphate-dependent enzyme [Candidatus Omnitrophota bacterium]